uniref:Uncharacterized protein n=1 Tax=Picea sitchensis TaxID=3332 RepID=A0A6B9XS50_PICSI|nr:hypothetical protein Q903MT_gene3815 [Picea sitchensis]
MDSTLVLLSILHVYILHQVVYLGNGAANKDHLKWQSDTSHS